MIGSFRVASRDFYLAHNSFFGAVGAWVAVEANGTALTSRSLRPAGAWSNAPITLPPIQKDTVHSYICIQQPLPQPPGIEGRGLYVLLRCYLSMPLHTAPTPQPRWITCHADTHQGAGEQATVGEATFLPQQACIARSSGHAEPLGYTGI